MLTLDRPEVRNAINAEVTEQMSAILDELEADRSCWAVVLTGAGPVFCAGMDLKAFSSGATSGISGKGGFAGITQRDFPKPLIAAVQGPALAGGFEIVLACDIVVAAETATFGIPEAKRGLVAAAGGVIRLPKRVSRAIALEFAMTGDPIDAQRAYQLGIVNRVVPADRVVDEAVAIAERICENSPAAVRAAKKIVVASHDLPEDEAWKVSRELSGSSMRSGDAQEGALAFVEKRKPNWSEPE